MRVVIVRGRVSIGDFFVRGSVYIEGCSEDLMYFFLFFLFQIHHILYIGLVTILTYIVLIFFFIDVCSFTYPYMCCFYSFFIHMILISCMQSIIFVSNKRCLDWFCLKCFRNTGC